MFFLQAIDAFIFSRVNVIRAPRCVNGRGEVLTDTSMDDGAKRTLCERFSTQYTVRLYSTHVHITHYTVHSTHVHRYLVITPAYTAQFKPVDLSR